MGPGFWTHERFMDVKLLVLKVQYADARKIKVKVEWWNRRGMFLGIRQTIVISTKDLIRWARVN